MTLALSLLPNTSTSPEIKRTTGPTTALPATQVQGSTRELTKPKRRGFAFAAIGVALVHPDPRYKELLKRMNLPSGSFSGDTQTVKLGSGSMPSEIAIINECNAVCATKSECVVGFNAVTLGAAFHLFGPRRAGDPVLTLIDAEQRALSAQE